MSASNVLLLEQRDRIWVATLNRPEKGNALNRELLDALDRLADVVDAAADDSRPRVLVITGAGTKAFSAGADINELDGIDGSTARTQMERGQRVFDRLERLPAIVIAAVNGFALGGGCELAMAADIRVAASTARLGQPEITLENLPGWGGTQRLPRLVGPARAIELIVTGQQVTAERAEQIGLVNHVVDDCVAASLALGESIAGRSGTALAGAKRAIRVGREEGVARGLAVEAQAVAECCETAEQRRAVGMFLHRRAARPRDP